MSKTTGFRVKYVEIGGTQLANKFVTGHGIGVYCGRDDCSPCTTNGEERKNCRDRNILYELLRTLCIKQGMDKLSTQQEEEKAPRKGIYIGESSMYV